MNKDFSEHDVVVVGGGAIGIYASMILKRNGLKPLIVEAQQQLGGRIRSHRVDEDFHVELGGQWLAKKGQRRLAELIKSHGFKRRSNYSEGAMVYFDEGKISHFKKNKLPLSLLTKLDSVRFAYDLEHYLKSIPADLSD